MSLLALSGDADLAADATDEAYNLLRTAAGPMHVAPPTGETWDLVHGLPERQRVAAVLRYVADLNEPDIAVAMESRGARCTACRSDL